jgi:hypothetical protein
VEGKLSDLTRQSYDLMFQQVDIDLTTDSDLLKSIKVEGDIPEGEELKPWDPLSKVFTCGPGAGHLHIIVKRPAGTCNCFQTALRCWLTIFCHPQAKLMLLLNRWILSPH